MSATHRILFVDDDERLLQSLARRFRVRYEIETALGPSRALDHLEKNGPPAIVVSDYQMPEMHGVAFLKIVGELYPETVRIMLTGQADLQVAMNAVNEGAIFRFLTKPCAGDVFCRAINDGIELGGLRRAEQELLERTLMGSVAVLCDVLSLSNPSAFGHALRMQELVKLVLVKARIQHPWMVEAAAMLSQVGWVSLPPDLLERAHRGEALRAEEQEAVRRLPEVAADLVCKVPRLDRVAKLIRGMGGLEQQLDDDEARSVAILTVVKAIVARLASTAGVAAAVQAVLPSFPWVPPDVAAAFTSLRDTRAVGGLRLVNLRTTVVGVVVARDVIAKDGTKLLGRGQALSASSLARLRTYVQLGRLEERILITDPADVGNTAA